MAPRSRTARLGWGGPGKIPRDSLFSSSSDEESRPRRPPLQPGVAVRFRTHAGIEEQDSSLLPEIASAQRTAFQPAPVPSPQEPPYTPPAQQANNPESKRPNKAASDTQSADGSDATATPKKSWLVDNAAGQDPSVAPAPAAEAHTGAAMRTSTDCCAAHADLAPNTPVKLQGSRAVTPASPPVAHLGSPPRRGYGPGLASGSEVRSVGAVDAAPTMPLDEVWEQTSQTGHSSSSIDGPTAIRCESFEPHTPWADSLYCEDEGSDMTWYNPIWIQERCGGSSELEMQYSTGTDASGREGWQQMAGKQQQQELQLLGHAAYRAGSGCLSAGSCSANSRRGWELQPEPCLPELGCAVPSCMMEEMSSWLGSDEPAAPAGLRGPSNKDPHHHESSTGDSETQAAQSLGHQLGTGTRSAPAGVKTEAAPAADSTGSEPQSHAHQQLMPVPGGMVSVPDGAAALQTVLVDADSQQGTAAPSQPPSSSADLDNEKQLPMPHLRIPKVVVHAECMSLATPKATGMEHAASACQLRLPGVPALASPGMPSQAGRCWHPSSAPATHTQVPDHLMEPVLGAQTTAAPAMPTAAVKSGSGMSAQVVTASQAHPDAVATAWQGRAYGVLGWAVVLVSLPLLLSTPLAGTNEDWPRLWSDMELTFSKQGSTGTHQGTPYVCSPYEHLLTRSKCPMETYTVGNATRAEPAWNRFLPAECDVLHQLYWMMAGWRLSAHSGSPATTATSHLANSSADGMRPVRGWQAGAASQQSLDAIVTSNIELGGETMVYHLHQSKVGLVLAVTDQQQQEQEEKQEVPHYHMSTTCSTMTLSLSAIHHERSTAGGTQSAILMSGAALTAAAGLAPTKEHAERSPPGATTRAVVQLVTLAQHVLAGLAGAALLSLLTCAALAAAMLTVQEDVLVLGAWHQPVPPPAPPKVDTEQLYYWLRPNRMVPKHASPARAAHNSPGSPERHRSCHGPAHVGPRCLWLRSRTVWAYDNDVSPASPEVVKLRQDLPEGY